MKKILLLAFAISIVSCSKEDNNSIKESNSNYKEQAVVEIYKFAKHIITNNTGEKFTANLIFLPKFSKSQNFDDVFSYYDHQYSEMLIDIDPFANFNSIPAGGSTPPNFTQDLIFSECYELQAILTPYLNANDIPYNNKYPADTEASWYFKNFFIELTSDSTGEKVILSIDNDRTLPYNPKKYSPSNINKIVLRDFYTGLHHEFNYQILPPQSSPITPGNPLTPPNNILFGPDYFENKYYLDDAAPVQLFSTILAKAHFEKDHSTGRYKLTIKKVNKNGEEIDEPN
ncbi:MAG: hypothetical protein LBE34_12710 [Flavobacteriaceae bacterium]|jgi:hypothetical protein|nr:hypothetical protein [Flavobacteriaceae bacterium]